MTEIKEEHKLDTACKHFAVSAREEYEQTRIMEGDDSEDRAEYIPDMAFAPWKVWVVYECGFRGYVSGLVGLSTNYKAAQAMARGRAYYWGDLGYGWHELPEDLGHDAGTFVVTDSEGTEVSNIRCTHTDVYKDKSFAFKFGRSFV